MTSDNQHRLAHGSSFQEHAPRLPRVWIESHSSGCGIHRKTKFLSSTHLLDFLFLTWTWWKLRLVLFSDKCLHVFLVFFFGEWYLEGEKWHMTYSIRPSLWREQNTHQGYWSSPAQYLDSTIRLPILTERLPRHFLGGLFRNLTVLADSYKSIPRGPISDNYVFNIEARVLHNDDFTYEATQITWWNFTNVNKQNKNQSSSWLPASITSNVAFTKLWFHLKHVLVW